MQSAIRNPQSAIEWWARRDSNPQPRDYESPALTIELQARDRKRSGGYYARVFARGKGDIGLHVSSADEDIQDSHRLHADSHITQPAGADA